MTTTLETLCRRTPRGLAALALGIGLITPTAARADCIASTPGILWSSPAPNQSDVPLNADLLVVAKSIQLERARPTLSSEGQADRTLVPSSEVPGHYDLGDLESHRTYSIRFGTIAEFEFTTGERRLETGVAPLSIAGVDEENMSLPFEAGPCLDMLFRNSCYDTGIPPVQTFDVDPGALDLHEQSLWVIETISAPSGERSRWTSPAECGARQFGYSGKGDEFRVYNVSDVGAVRESDAINGPFGVTARGAGAEATMDGYPISPAQTESGGVSCAMSQSPRQNSLVLSLALGLGAALTMLRRRARSF